MSASAVEKRIFVGNIHSSVTEEILFELFLQAGPVEKVYILRNEHQMPYGLVYYKHTEAVPYAVELLDGIWIYGQPIRLQCKYGYQESDMWCTGMNSGVITNRKGAVYRHILDVNNNPGLGNHCQTPHGWNNMLLNQSYGMCLSVVPSVVCYSTPLQHLMDSGYPSWRSYQEERALFFRSSNNKVACANVSLVNQKHEHRNV